MKAMLLTQDSPQLAMRDIPAPVPERGQLLIHVHTCGVCRTDLHIVDGELPEPHYPIIPGHEIVGTVAALGAGVEGFQPGQRVGVPWLGYSCGNCDFCRRGQENLCDHARFTGYTLPGGYAEYVVAESRFCFSIPEQYSDEEAAPLLCAGLIGFRAYRMVGDSEHIGIYGFGGAAHLITQIAVAQERKIYALTRPGDNAAQRFARELGAAWSGDSTASPPQPLDAAIIFAPAGALVPQALHQVRKGGRVVCAGIHMSAIPSFPYELLWGERQLCSVANLTRQDGLDFMAIASQVRLRVATVSYPLDNANEALNDFRNGRFVGAAVLRISNRIK